MKTITLFFALFLCIVIGAQAQIKSQADFDALESQYEKFVKERDSPQKAEFLKKLCIMRDEMVNQMQVKITTKKSFTELENKKLAQTDVYIGYLDRWITFLKKDQIRQLPEFKALWAQLKPLRQQYSPELYKVQSELFDRACQEAYDLPEADRKKRLREIVEIFNILNTLPEEPEP